jgi:rhodanese-related sulfurtransferase
MIVDLREAAERERRGVIPGALHAPYPALQENLAPGGMLRRLADKQRLVFVCAFGERSAMAVQAAHDAGIDDARHIHGGVAAWIAAGGPVVEKP